MKYLFFDTETTGLLENSLMPIHKQPHVIEFFGVVFDENEQELGSLDLLLKPPVKLDEVITRITGLKDEDLADKPTFGQMATTIATFLDDTDVLLAHNLSFDMQIMAYEFERAGIAVPWVEHPIELICTVEATEHLKGYRLSLSDLHLELFGEVFQGAHRAQADVRAMAKCYFEAMRRNLL